MAVIKGLFKLIAGCCHGLLDDAMSLLGMGKRAKVVLVMFISNGADVLFVNSKKLLLHNNYIEHLNAA